MAKPEPRNTHRSNDTLKRVCFLALRAHSDLKKHFVSEKVGEVNSIHMACAVTESVQSLCLSEDQINILKDFRRQKSRTM